MKSTNNNIESTNNDVKNNILDIKIHVRTYGVFVRSSSSYFFFALQRVLKNKFQLKLQVTINRYQFVFRRR